MQIEWVIIFVGFLLLLGIGAAYTSGRFGVPVLVLFLAMGMLVGSDGPGGVYFDNPRLAQSVGVVALLFILYAGGLQTSWKAIRPVLAPGLVLANAGVIVSATLLGLFAWWVLGFNMLEGFLLGAIISSTDAAAVFASLRIQNVRLRGNLEPLLELESGSNDPAAVLLTSGVTALIMAPETPMWTLVPNFLLQMAVGAIGGLAAGWLIVRIINRIRLQQDGLYSVLSVALILAAFGLVWLGWGNGFLAVYVAGIVVGNSRVVHKNTIVGFHDGIAWLSQIVMFFTLGLLVFPSQLPAVAGLGIATALFLTLVARPLSVVLTVFWAGLSWRELTLISWAGLRGAVPIVLATFPLLAGVGRASQIFDLIFFVVVFSVLLQGATLGSLARRLGLNPEEEEIVPADVFAEAQLHAVLISAGVPLGSTSLSKPLFDLRLPPGVLVAQIHRGREVFVPGGNSVLRPGDVLMILGDEETASVLEAVGFVIYDVRQAGDTHFQPTALDPQPAS